MFSKYLVALWVLTSSANAFSQNVLIIKDSDDASTFDFADGLRDLGFAITLSETIEIAYTGSNPAPDDFDVVIHLNGPTFGAEMPATGQQSLVDFVKDGGVYIGCEWNAFELSVGRLTTMQDLVLLNRTSSSSEEGAILSPAEGMADNPIVHAIDLSVTYASRTNRGFIRSFEEFPAQAILVDDNGYPAVAMRELERGVAFHVSFPLNYLASGRNFMSDTNLHDLYAAIITEHGGITVSYGTHTCLLQDGVRCFGANTAGQLGLGDSQNRGDDSMEMGRYLPAVDLGEGFDPVQVETGSLHTCARSDRGKIKCWGRNHMGQLGLGDTTKRGTETGQMGDELPIVDLGDGYVATDIALGREHTCALLDSGYVKCWGGNTFGQLGLGHTETWGDQVDEMGDSLYPVQLREGALAADIAAGANHTCALLSDDRLTCWGANASGQLGVGSTEAIGTSLEQMRDNLAPIDLAGARVKSLALGQSHTCALQMDGQAICWGENKNGQLALGHTNDIGDEAGEMGASLHPVMLGQSQVLDSLQCGGDSCCAVLLQGTVKCWGDNTMGRLGLGDAEPRGTSMDTTGDNLRFVDFGSLSRVRSLTMGRNHTCARLAEGWKCWGLNRFGALGAGHTHHLGFNEETIPSMLPFIEL